MSATNINLEIERKYLLDAVPALPKQTKIRLLEQGYLPERTETGGALAEGRLRREVLADGSVIFTNTIKKGTGLVRSEFERSLTVEEFAKLWPETEGRRLRKMRYLVREGDFVWAIDAFEMIDLVLAEVELPSEDAVAPVPGWLQPHIVREVTGEPEFQSYAVARRMHEALRG
jgi:adenylate cyclase